jgi:hypothetical protein
MSTLPLAVAPLQSASEFPRWMLWGILISCILALGITVWALFSRRGRDYDPFEAPGEALDATSVIEAITDPHLPAVGYERPEPDTQPVPVYGTVVETADWATAMTVPAPEIVARPTGLADEWIAAFERGEQPDTDAFSQRILASAGL